MQVAWRQAAVVLVSESHHLQFAAICSQKATESGLKSLCIIEQERARTCGGETA